MIGSALELAAAGWSVFPLKGKRPLTPRGFRGASSDPDVIREWWERWPKANIGAAVPDSFAVVDVDGQSGLQSLQDLQDRFGQLPNTLTVQTGSGGLHLYFLHPGGELRQGAGILGPGIDTRMPGKGYLVMPSSLHPGTGQEYSWVDPDASAAPMPRWMVAKLRPKPQPRRPEVTYTAEGRLAGLCKAVASAAEGQRNHVLNWAAYRARELGDPTRVVEALTDAARQAGLDDREIAATIRSGLGVVA